METLPTTPSPSTGSHIPTNLQECFTELDKLLDASQIEDIKNCAESDLIQYLFSLGLWLRNAWGLWHQGDLNAYFDELGISHPDGISTFIIKAYWRYLNQQPTEAEK